MQQNESKYYFIRHGQLVEPYLDYLTMDYKTLTDLSTSTLDPGLNNNAFELFKEQTQSIDLSKIEIIYYNNSESHSQRSRESADIILKNFSNEYKKNILVEGLPELHEIRFKVSDLVPLE